MFGARFDDAVGGESFVLLDPVEELVAKTTSDVRGVLDRATAAAADGNWVAGYLSYEAAAAFDRLAVSEIAAHQPLAWFGVFDTREPVHDLPDSGPHGSYTISGWTPALDAKTYGAAFDATREHIRVGDAYQVNLTFPMTSAFHGEPAALYADLLAAQRPAYACHIHHGDRHILSISPERFFTIDGQRIVTSPMKGTVRRGRWEQEDREQQRLLIGSDKDRAENLMIVDLIRNDLGRVAEFGSVSVDALFEVERYPSVWQMTSTIEADLRPDVSLTDVFGALFPCGSVTGAPKTRAMEIIEDLEAGPRGVYCGAIGFIPPGDGRSGASFNVAIRTVDLNMREGAATYGVGGGITWYSDTADEYAEALTKTVVLRRHVPTQGLIETIRWDPHEGWVWLDDHLERLSGSARFFEIPVNLSDVTLKLEEAVEGRTTAARVRLVVSKDGTEVTVDAAPDVFHPGPHLTSEYVSLAVDDEPVDRTDPGLFHKTTNRDRYEQARHRHPKADDVVLVNEVGQITETTIANIAVLRDGQWITPPIADGLLGGVMRARLLADGTLIEASIPRLTLAAADAIAVFNSVRGWRAAVLLPS